MKALKLWLKIVLHSVLNRVLCVKSGICWSRGSYDALFCTQEGGIIAAVIVATQNTQATASNTSIYCMCTDISVPTSGTCTIKSLNIKKMCFIVFFLKDYRLRQTVSFCFFVLLSLIGSFCFAFRWRPVGGGWGWGWGVFSGRAANAVGLSPTQKGEIRRVRWEPLRVCLTLCITAVPRGPPLPPPLQTPSRRPCPPDPGPWLFRGVWPGASWRWRGRGVEGGGLRDLDWRWA